MVDGGTWQAVGDYGAITVLHVTFMVGLFWALFKYAPKMWTAHIELIKEMQNEHSELSKDMQRSFSNDLTRITTESALTNKGFLDQIEQINKDHATMNEQQEVQVQILKEVKDGCKTQARILSKIDKKQDIIHDHVNEHNIKCKHQ